MQEQTDPSRRVQVGQDLLRGDLLYGSITEFMDKPSDNSPVSSHRVFLGMCLVAIDSF
jgi:hypothetical protein